MKKNKLIIVFLSVVVAVLVGGYLGQGGNWEENKEIPEERINYSAEFVPNLKSFEFGQYLDLKPMKNYDFRTEATFSIDTINFFTKKTGDYGEGSEVLWYQKSGNSEELKQVKLEDNKKLFPAIARRSNMVFTKRISERKYPVEKSEGIVTTKGEFIELVKILGEEFPLEDVLVSHSLKNDYEFLIVSKLDAETIQEKFEVFLYKQTQGVVKQESLIDFFKQSTGVDISDALRLGSNEPNYYDVFENIKTDGLFIYILNSANKEIIRLNSDLSKYKSVALDNYEAVELQYVRPEELFFLEMRKSAGSSYYVMNQDLELIPFKEFPKKDKLFLYNSKIERETPLKRTINVIDFSNSTVIKKKKRQNIEQIETNVDGDIVIPIFVNKDQQVRKKLKKIGISFTEEEFSGDYFRNVLLVVKQEQLADFIEGYLTE